MRVAITGGAGFIGSALIRWIYEKLDWKILNIDTLTYAGNLGSLNGVSSGERYKFAKTNICEYDAVEKDIFSFQPDYLIHLAAESHVDRSIEGPLTFIETNILGTHNMLQAGLRYFETLSGNKRKIFRFHHVSTDEVYGTLGASGVFREDSPYKPNSPYAASKASSNHFVRAWYKTYGFPVTISNCSNNYGPYQFPEKLIPRMVLNAMAERTLPLYGTGNNIRDWLYVDDHVEAILAILKLGKPGECYNVGGSEERRNTDVVNSICRIMDTLIPNSYPYEKLIKYVPDRRGHDLRYAVDSTKITEQTGWIPRVEFEDGLLKTVKWYLENRDWWEGLYLGDHFSEPPQLVIANTS